MKRMVCEMCGSTDLIKQDGVFVCESCGCKYSAEEAKKLMIEIEGVADAHHDANEKSSRKAKKLLAILGILIIACAAVFFAITKVIIPNNNYTAAVALMESGKYDEAIAAFEAMDGYKDSANQIENCYIGMFGEERWNTIKNLKVGDTYTFGAYEQDNDISNGKEAINWIVLEKDGMSLLLISDKALDCYQYNTYCTDVTWESCSLRKWMNGTFLNKAFSAEEQAQIQNTTVSADKKTEYSTNPGNATTDKVFLLSINEAEKYFTTDESRRCAPTAYAKAQGAWSIDGNKLSSGEASCRWWLRSPGDDQRSAAVVRTNGSVYYYGDDVNNSNVCVRPALWINLGD